MKCHFRVVLPLLTWDRMFFFFLGGGVDFSCKLRSVWDQVFVDAVRIAYTCVV